MDPKGSAAMSAHVVFFAAAALFIAAQSARPPVAGDAWHGLSHLEAGETSEACAASIGTAETYLDRLGLVLWQAEGASFVGEYMGGCER